MINSQKKIIRIAKAWNVFKNNAQANKINYYESLIIEDENEIYLSKTENEKDSNSQDIEKNK